MAEIDEAVDHDLDRALFGDAVRLLCSIPGVSDLTAQVIVSEIGGTDPRLRKGRHAASRPPAHLISWAGLCLRNDESAGKRRSNKMRKGAPWQ